MQRDRYDAVVVGAGPNGLAAAITLAAAGRSVLVVEAQDIAGGGLRSAELTLPGYIHDVCAAVHPLGVASPFFRAHPLSEYGLSWVFPPINLAHPLDDGTAVLLERSIQRTASGLGPDGQVYSKLMGGLTADWAGLMVEVLAPLHLPRHPLLFTRFGLTALQPAASFAGRTFRGERARALFAGLAAHSTLPLSAPLTSAFASGTECAGPCGRLAGRAWWLWPDRRCVNDPAGGVGRRATDRADRDAAPRPAAGPACAAGSDAEADCRHRRRRAPWRISARSCAATATAPASSRWITPWMGRSPGARRAAHWPPRSISAGRWRKSQRQRRP